MVTGSTNSAIWPDRVTALLVVALVLQLGWMAGQLSWRLVATPVTLAPLYAGPGAGSTGVRPVPDIALAALNLFGSGSSTVEVPAAISQNAPDTQLSLVLTGIVLATQPENSSAIVADGRTGDVSRYRVGDELPGNARLVEVQGDRILLRRQGRIETLRFPESGESGMGVAASTTEPPSTEEFLAEAESRLAEDPAAALAAIGFSPVDGSGRGGYVFDGSNPMLRAMNLQAGDRILVINGHVLGNMEADRELLRQWAQQDQLQIEVERNGSRFTVTVPVP